MTQHAQYGTPNKRDLRIKYMQFSKVISRTQGPKNQGSIPVEKSQLEKLMRYQGTNMVSE